MQFGDWSSDVCSSDLVKYKDRQLVAKARHDRSPSNRNRWSSRRGKEWMRSKACERKEDRGHAERLEGEREFAERDWRDLGGTAHCQPFNVRSPNPIIPIHTRLPNGQRASNGQGASMARRGDPGIPERLLPQRTRGPWERELDIGEMVLSGLRTHDFEAR